MATKTVRQPAARRRVETAGDEITKAKLRHAEERLKLPSGRKTRAVSTRQDPALIEMVKAKLGVETDTEAIAGALKIVAGEDNFWAWLLTQSGTLSPDFDLDELL
ncbi:hypothetical protein D3874_11865 [Oleomonas cavernae]|uniref:Uncharacterized protein n=1 Tax=Oleomonas cavernae TaxID=2320859 RepID=A0A418WC71_9PROT|nr:hypothetical protein [Oleomonas cavernae]RJF87631.1 hypothetical protein D3874_11865 [Oleomonas cavernae]